MRDFNETLQREREWRKQHSYPVNQFWASADQRTMSSALSDSNSAEQAVGCILKSELYVHHVELVDKSIEWHVRTYARLELDLDRLPAAVQDQRFFRKAKRDNATRDDCHRTFSVAHRAARLMSGQQRPRILELRCRNWDVARLFRAIHGAARYSICDIPETLIFARFYLSIERPGASFELCVGANDIRQREAVARRADRA